MEQRMNLECLTWRNKKKLEFIYDKKDSNFFKNYDFF